MSAAKKKPLEFPDTDKAYNVAFKALMAHLAIPDPDSTTPLVNTWTRLNIDATTIYNPLVANLGTATTNNTWLHVFPLQENKITRNATTKLQKNTLKKDGLSIIRSERKILKEQDRLTPGFLTANDKLVWFIPEVNVATNTAATLRTSFPIPVLSVFKRMHLQHIIDMHDSENPTSRALPDGIILIEIFRYIGTVAPTDPSQFTHLLFSTTFRNLTSYLVSQVKQDAWYTARFIGSQGEEGALAIWINAVTA
jgi:hypothetical protein